MAVFSLFYLKNHISIAYINFYCAMNPKDYETYDIPDIVVEKAFKFLLVTMMPSNASSNKAPSSYTMIPHELSDRDISRHRES